MYKILKRMYEQFGEGLSPLDYFKLGVLLKAILFIHTVTHLNGKI